jgi:hypothetical protein
MLRSREVTEADRSQIEQWIQSDEDHRGRCKADFWLTPEDGVKLFAVEDALGTIFYVRGENLLRLHIQFAPESERRRTAKAVDEFTSLIAAGAKKSHYKQLIYESVVQPLIKFLEKRGFHSSPAEQVYDL